MVPITSSASARASARRASRGSRPRRRHRGGSLAGHPPAGRPLALRTRGRRHHPGRIRAVHALSRRRRRRGDWNAKIGNYLRRIRTASGGWPLYHGGDAQYQRQRQGLFRPEDDRRRSRRSAHEGGARAAILAQGGAAGANVFTRFLLALYDVVPWTAVPRDAGGNHAAAALVSFPSRRRFPTGPGRWWCRFSSSRR